MCDTRLASSPWHVAKPACRSTSTACPANRGYIGLNDYTLYPLIRPGSFVEIDAQQNKIQSGRWENEFRRPIYFVELRDTYVCSWCEIAQGRLVLLAYTRSGQQVRQVRYPGDAEIVGRVTAVAMSLTDEESNTEELRTV
jgi:hypothetical protein